jgi:sec-independent protein translocase protein TatC
MKSATSKKKLYNENNDEEMSISEHLNELRDRLSTILIIFSISTITSFLILKKLTVFLQQPANGVKFLQLAPGEYFFVSMKIALYFGLLLSCPFAIYQLIRFILPGLTRKEASIIIPVLVGSIFLFFIGIIFGY